MKTRPKPKPDTAPDKALAATLALAALTGTLAIWQPKLAQMQSSLRHAALTGDVSGLYWDDEDEDEETDPYERFGAVAVVTVSGVLLPTSSWWMRYLGYRSTPEIAEAIRKAGDDANIKTIVLKIESPGGHIQGIAELADTVKLVGETKRVISYTSGLLCSCAYWVASQTARIYASRLADVGCIGTLFVVSDWSEHFKQNGVTVDAITSTGAETYKGAGTYGTTLTKEQKADFKRICDECQVHFTTAVAEGRFGGDVKKAQALATGQVHVGPAAKALGLVDEIVPDTFDAWLSRLSGADGVDYDDKAPLPTEDETLPIDNTTTARSGKENQPMSVWDKLKAVFIEAGISVDEGTAAATPAANAPVVPPGPTAEQVELQRFRDEATTRLTARRATATAIATTAFGTTNPTALTAMTTAIASAPDEATLTALEAACTAVTPAALQNSNRVSSGQEMDKPASDAGTGATTADQEARLNKLLGTSELGQRALAARKN